MKGLLQTEKKQEDIGRRKSQLERTSFKLASTQIKKKTTTNLLVKVMINTRNKINEKDKHINVKKDTKIRKCGEGQQKNTD